MSAWVKNLEEESLVVSHILTFPQGSSRRSNQHRWWCCWRSGSRSRRGKIPLVMELMHHLRLTPKQTVNKTTGTEAAGNALKAVTNGVEDATASVAKGVENGSKGKRP